MTQIHQTDKRTGIEYVYESESYWDKEKKQSRYKPRKLIGHIDKKTGEIVPNRPMRTSPKDPLARRLFCGADYLLEQVSEQIGLSKDLKDAFPGIDKALLSIAHYFVCEDSSAAARFERWSRTHAHPFAAPIASQRLSELFEHVGQTGAEALFALRVARSSGAYWFYDTTSISSYSQLIESVRWGRNKDKVALPQINVAAVLDAKTGQPVWFKDLAGNITDVVLVRELLAEAKRYGAKRMRLCFDRGFYSKTNIDALLGEHMKFLVGLKCSLVFVRGAIKENAHALRDWKNYDNETHTWGMRMDHPWDFERRHPRKATTETGTRRTYLYLYFSAERALREEDEFSQFLSILINELNRGNYQDEHTKLYERYFKRVRGGKYVGRDDAIQAERDTFGYFALLSNDASLNPREALGVYRDKDRIEKAFGDIKDRLDFRTPRVENAETLRGKLLCVFVGLILATELRGRMHKADLYKKHTMVSLIDELETIERYESLGHLPRILSVTEKQKELFESLGVKPLTAS